jgi:pimeloyl-ACP methyl ester carboxylesterase
VLDLAAVVDNGAAQVDLPLGMRVPDALAATGRHVSAVLDDVDWDAVDYLDDTSWLQVPALVLHTTGDTTVPISSSRELVDREPDLARLVELEGEHAAGYTTDPERYLREVRRLLAEVA